MTASLVMLTPSAGASTTESASAPLGKVTIDVAAVNGTGCPPGTAAVAVAPDNSAFTVTYSSYMAQVGPGAPATAGRRNCLLSLVVHIPQGYTYAIAQADYRGFASLAAGALGTQKAGYYFQGMSQTAQRTHEFAGPFSDNWQTTDTTRINALSWSPCGEQRNFNINTELRVEAGTSSPSATSFMALDSTDGSVTSIYHFSWKQCPGR
ncbi:DUF4360 domain-containing protein [Streptomyces sp. NBC_00161]|uniref:DUF4360 domain-containing protein n=1 Tax=Streptomyces sp. NBC_00161 TaxID=2975671 RepID=UPI00386E2B3C